MLVLVLVTVASAYSRARVSGRIMMSRSPGQPAADSVRVTAQSLRLATVPVRSDSDSGSESVPVAATRTGRGRDNGFSYLSNERPGRLAAANR